MIRVDRAAPVIHHPMRAARAKPQVGDPDEFSTATEWVTLEDRRGTGDWRHLDGDRGPWLSIVLFAHNATAPP
jgi:hypothetical protein